MIFFSMGLPSRFADWCGGVLGRLVHYSLGPMEWVATEDLESVALNAIRTSCPHLIGISRQPHGSLRQALQNLNARSITSLNHPREAVWQLFHQGHTVTEATRMVARSCAALITWMRHSTTLLLRVEDAAADPIGMAKTIAAHFQLPVTQEMIEASVAEIGYGPVAIEGNTPDTWTAELSESERTMIEGALGGYAAYFATGDMGPLIWERDLFYAHEQPFTPPHPPADRPIDISGTARRIIFGPHISLPAGSWQALVSGAFSKEAAEIGYSILVSAGDTVLSQVAVKPEPERILHANLHFSIGEGFDQLVEVCVQMDRASIGGRMALVNVVLSPVRTEHSDAKGYL